MLVQDPTLYRRFYGVFKAEYFSDRKLALIARAVFDCYDLQRNTPTADTLCNYVAHRYSDWHESAQAENFAILSELFELEIADKPIIESLIVEWAKSESLIEAVKKAAGAVEAKQPDRVLPIIQDALKVGTDMSSMGTMLNRSTDGFLDRLKERHVNSIATGLNILDGKLGSKGIAPGEMLLWLGPPKGYKSGHLINCSYHALQHKGKKCTYLSLELSEDQVFERYCHHIANMTAAELHGEDKGKAWEKALLENLDKWTGQLNIRRWPLRGASCDTFRNYLDLLSSNGHETEMLMVDYVNIISPSGKTPKSDKEHMVQGSLPEELKALAVERNVACVSAIRTNRDALKDSNITAAMIAGSVEALSCADYVVAIIKNEELDRVREVRHKILMNRNEEQNTVISAQVDYGRHTITQTGLILPEEAKNVGEKREKYGRLNRVNPLDVAPPSPIKPGDTSSFGSASVSAIPASVLEKLKQRSTTPHS